MVEEAGRRNVAVASRIVAWAWASAAVGTYVTTVVSDAREGLKADLLKEMKRTRGKHG